MIIIAVAIAIAVASRFRKVRPQQGQPIRQVALRRRHQLYMRRSDAGNGTGSNTRRGSGTAPAAASATDGARFEAE